MNKNKSSKVANSISYLKERGILCNLVIMIILIFIIIYDLIGKFKNFLGLNMCFYRIAYIICLVGILVCTYLIIYKIFFQKKENFNIDTQHFFFIYVMVEVFFGCLCFILGFNDPDNYVYGISILFITSAAYFWLIYLMNCIKIIKVIKKEKSVFLVNSIKSMLGAILIWFSAKKMFVSLIYEPDYMYQVINIEVNLIYPLLDMYVYVRSEIDEFDKQEQEKREEQEKQKREKLEQEKHEKEKQKREKLEQEKHEKEKQEQEKEKYKYDFYNYD